ncbi:hypothetical protein [Pontixanthobacter sp.]|uniref:hypothetical protein n=1 Tax=Pontixanthobacter sp. TaxID=2792078 RepID=UPI003C7D0772
MRSVFLALAGTTAICISAPAMAQAIPQGTYVNQDDSAKWVFGARTGSFIQYKSINGNPGVITIEFEYSVSGGMMTYRQTRISLTDHPMARTQTLDKTSTEQIEIRPDAIVIGGAIYRRS